MPSSSGVPKVGDAGEAHAQQAPGALPAHGLRLPEDASDVVEVLGRRQVVVEEGVLRQVADAVSPARIPERHPEHAGRSALGEREAHQDLQGRGLARAVGPQVAEDLALVHFQAQVFQGDSTAPGQESDAVALAEPREPVGGATGGSR
jgi:hypothetical protein